MKILQVRLLDLKIHLPEYLSSLDNDLRQVASGKLFRGSIILKIKVSQHSELSNQYFLNDQVLNTVFEKIQNIEKICKEKNITLEPLKASDFFGIKGVWEEDKNTSTFIDDMKSIILDKANELIESLLEARKKEGQGLLTILADKLASILALNKAAEEILPERSKHLEKNFKSLIDKIMSEHSQLDENKIEHEIAIIAIKQDITE